MQERDVWQLLFQVDTDDAAGMMWCDVGRIYYMATNQDLAAQNWGACRFTFQCGYLRSESYRLACGLSCRGGSDIADSSTEPSNSLGDAARPA
jgi:hypothetical protein